MSTSRRILFVALGTAIAVLAVVGSAFGFYRWSHAGQVLGDVTAATAALGGLTPDEAGAAVLQVEDIMISQPASFVVNGSTFELQPILVEFDVDEDLIVGGAMEIGRGGSTWSQFAWWLQSFGESYVIPLTGSIDGPALHAILDFWEEESDMNVPFDGGINLEGTTPVAAYPTNGQGIDRTGLETQVLDLLLTFDRQETVLPIDTIPPRLTTEDVDRALAKARKFLSGPVILERDDPEVSVTFSVDQLAQAFRSQLFTAPTPQLWLGFDPVTIDSYLNPIRADLEAAPRDAQLVVNEDDTIAILPSRPGTLVDSNLATEAVELAAGSFSRVGEFPFEDGAEPEMTTEDIEALGVNHLVSAFTTYHSCCQDRVFNIHLIADEIDGALVLPGEEFSLNEYVGFRTAAEGYREAGTIINGELVDTVGGGVSQFATTFYNPIFWGGYEDVDHSPHSLYFSRYPEGIEATISWPAPNLIFRNNTESAVLIKTEYTDTSITVKFFGDNGGRTVVGEQKGGETIIEVVSPGVNARVVEATVSGRSGFTSSTTKYRGNPEIEVDEEHVVSRGGRGWSVNVTRTITWPDGTVTEDHWTVRYRPGFEIIEVHPCMVPEGPPHEGGSGEECPEATTTTIEGATTTTIEGATTTTTTNATQPTTVP